MPSRTCPNASSRLTRASERASARRLLTAAFFFTQLLSVASSQENERSVLVLGDSLSAAYGIDVNVGWVNLLQQRLMQHNPSWKVVNGSISGDTTSSGLSRLPSLLRQHKPAIVLIELGSNDGLRGFAFKQIRENLQKRAPENSEFSRALSVSCERLG